MWKKLFVVLLSLNLLAFVSVALWFGTLPPAHATPATPAPYPTAAAHVQLTIGPQAINTYLTYALDEQTELHRVLGYANVSFADSWDIRFGLKLAGRLVPCDIRLSPQIHGGNLWLPLDGASIGGVAVPKRLLFYLFGHVTWPTWIVVDAGHQRIDVNLSDRPSTSPYRIRALHYSATTKSVTFLVSILPKQLTVRH